MVMADAAPRYGMELADNPLQSVAGSLLEMAQILGVALRGRHRSLVRCDGG